MRSRDYMAYSSISLLIVGLNSLQSSLKKSTRALESISAYQLPIIPRLMDLQNEQSRRSSNTSEYTAIIDNIDGELGYLLPSLLTILPPHPPTSTPPTTACMALTLALYTSLMTTNSPLLLPRNGSIA